MQDTINEEYLIETKNVTKFFVNIEGQKLLVLDSINLQIREGEIVALLGKSGSGKSTLLRIISGLIKPSAGEVFYRNTIVTEAVSGMAMVFQTFALMPWLTVLENVELLFTYSLYSLISISKPPSIVLVRLLPSYFNAS